MTLWALEPGSRAGVRSDSAAAATARSGSMLPSTSRRSPHSGIPELIEGMERKGHLSLPVDVRGKLLTISSASADRLLVTERSNQRGVSTTRPGSLLKKQIKVRTFADWDDLQPGFLEAGLVAHCSYQSACLNCCPLHGGA